MCPPDYYGIEYEINPWMSRSRQSDPELSTQLTPYVYPGVGCRWPPHRMPPDPILGAPARARWHDQETRPCAQRTCELR
jgi:hypothetical protein